MTNTAETQVKYDELKAYIGETMQKPVLCRSCKKRRIFSVLCRLTYNGLLRRKWEFP